MRKLIMTLAICIAVVIPGLPAHADNGVACKDVKVPVKIGLSSYTVAGSYCAPKGTPRAVYVAVPGASYNRWYWDPSYQPDNYSFARQAAQAGDAALAIDRIGTGKSSKPLSATVLASVQAKAIAQVTRYVQSDKLGTGSAPVFLVGHSLGSVESLLAAADHQAAIDGLILTGFSTKPNLVKVAEVVAVQSYPAILDPTMNVPLDPGYLTTRPGVRNAAFHLPGKADPGMIAADEAHKDVYSVAEFPDSMALILLLGHASGVKVPVLVANGAVDSAFCGTGARDCSSNTALVEAEAKQFTGAPCVAAITVPKVGHDLSLHPTAMGTHQKLRTWAHTVADGGCPTTVR